MLALTLSLLFGTASVGSSETDRTLTPGLYPAGVLLRASAALDGHPSIVQDPTVGSYPVTVRRALPLGPDTLVTVDMLLRTGGIFRLPYRDRLGHRFTFVTQDPRHAPARKLPFEVEILPLRYADALTASRILNDAVIGREGHRSEGVRTRFVGDPRTGRLLVCFTSEAPVKEYIEIVKRLDAAPAREAAPVLRTYRCRYLWADVVAEKLRARWADRGAIEISIIPNVDTNRLLLRLPSPLWPTAKKLLTEIDHR